MPLLMALSLDGEAIARPFVYVASFAHGGAAKECLDSGEMALKKFKFTEKTWQDYNPKENAKVGRVYGTHAESSTTAVILCDQKDGVTSLAVGGLDQQVTWDLYGDLFKAEW